MNSPVDPAWTGLRSAVDMVPAPVLCVAPDATQAWPNAAAHALAPGASWLPSLQAAGLLRPTPQAAELPLPAVDRSGTVVDSTATVHWLRARSQPLPGGGWTVALEAIDELRAARAEADKRGVWLDLLRGSGQDGLGQLDAQAPTLRARSDSAAERVALATHAAGMGTWELDLRDDVSRWDAQMWRLRGREPLPRAMTEAERMAIVHPDDHERIASAHAAAMASDAPAAFEFRVIWPDGQVRWLASRSIVQQEDTGPPRRRIGVNWDITDERNSAAVRQEREIALRENAAKSRFMARISHELRTPLNAVLGFAQLLLAEEAADEPMSRLREQRLRHIRTAGQHLLTLINDLLDLSGMESGEMRIAVQPLQLAPLVHGTMPLLESLLSEHGVAMHCDEILGEVMADPTRLRQVLLNLLSNAVKYNRPHGTVRVSARAEGAEIAIAIADTGLGLDQTQQQGLFEPFNRLGAEVSLVEGAGIGLVITRKLVERMGGRLVVRSRAGEGSVFEVWLRASDGAHAGSPLGVSPTTTSPPPAGSTAPPLVASTAPPSPLVDRCATKAQVRHRVLYVEDNAVNAMIVSEVLAPRSDIELFVAVDGLSGVARARELRPDLVLLDMQLPDIDGLEVMRRLRGNLATANIPCIAVSANAMREDIDRTLRAGAADYWIKPLDLAAFRAALDALFGPSPPEPAPAHGLAAEPAAAGFRA